MLALCVVAVLEAGGMFPLDTTQKPSNDLPHFRVRLMWLQIRQLWMVYSSLWGANNMYYLRVESGENKFFFKYIHWIEINR